MSSRKRIIQEIQFNLLLRRRFRRLIKICICVFCLSWLFIASTFLQRVDQELHETQKPKQNTFIINVPLIGKLEYNRNEGPFMSLTNGGNGSKHFPGFIISKKILSQDTKPGVRERNKSQRATHEGASPFQNISLRNAVGQLQGRNFHFFNESFVISDPYLKSWSKQKTVLCGGNFQGHANKFVRWINITIDSSKSRGAYGGEDISQVLRQKELRELLNPSKGFFQVDCKTRPKYTFSRYINTRGHLPNWLNVVKQLNPFERHIKTRIVSNFTIALQRYEYANIYHSMNDIFNVFLLHIFYHKDPADTIILFADGHPKGHIDSLWEKLFGKVIRVRHLKERVKFKELIWPMLEKFSPLNMFDLKQVSYIDHFRTFVLGKYGIVPRPAPDCNNIQVLFIWRHDYLSHPRNPKGKLMRKIRNENDLFNKIKSAFPRVNFQAVDLSPLSMEQQIELISKTDIMIGMHGAGLMLELFLPPKGGLIELLPQKLKGFSKKQYDLFKVITDRIPLHYLRWQNKDRRNEIADGYTYIPPQVVKDLLQNLLGLVCPKYSFN